MNDVSKIKFEVFEIRLCINKLFYTKKNCKNQTKNCMTNRFVSSVLKQKKQHIQKNISNNKFAFANIDFVFQTFNVFNRFLKNEINKYRNIKSISININ